MDNPPPMEPGGYQPAPSSSASSGNPFMDFWNSGAVAKLVIVGGGLFTCCCGILACLFVIGALAGDDLAPSLSTSVPLTEDPGSVATAEAEEERPTEDGTTLDGDSTIYLLVVLGQLEIIGEAATETSTLLEQVDGNPGLLLDEEWKQKVRDQADLIQGANDALQELTPPAELEDAHEVLLSGTADCSSGVGLLVKGIDELEADYFTDAEDLLLSCQSKLIDAIDQMQTAIP